MVRVRQTLRAESVVDLGLCQGLLCSGRVGGLISPGKVFPRFCLPPPPLCERLRVSFTLSGQVPSCSASPSTFAPQPQNGISLWRPCWLEGGVQRSRETHTHTHTYAHTLRTHRRNAVDAENGRARWCDLISGNERGTRSHVENGTSQLTHRATRHLFTQWQGTAPVNFTHRMICRTQSLFQWCAVYS